MAKRLPALPRDMHIDIDRSVFNEVYLPYVEAVHEFEVFYGGSGSGKSFAIGQILALQMTIMEGRNLVCLRRQKTDCISSCWGDIYGALSFFGLLPYWEIKENPDHVMINRVNGNQIHFDGVDNIEDIKSIKFVNKVTQKSGNLTDVWYEEVNAQESVDAINELDRRLRDPFVKTRIILSFNPVSRSHWLYDFVTNVLPNSGRDVSILKTTYKDNKFLKKDYGEKLEQYKFTSPYDYQVYALGNWGTMGQSVFNVNAIQRRLDYLNGKKFRAGTFYYDMSESRVPLLDSFKFLNDIDGDTVIFKEPEPNRPYVLGVDTAGEGSDSYAGHVIDNITGEQVARFKSKMKPDECAYQIIGLGKMYNYALICPEINFDSWIIKMLQMVEYPCIYRRQSPVDKTHIRSEDKLGWRTGVDNRQMMITDMIYWTNEHMDCINDVDTLNEMITFTSQAKKLKGIWMGAEAGCHDDLVMSFAITLQARSQQYMEMKPDIVRLSGFWTKWELEDAIAEGRIDKMSAMEYIRANGYYGSSQEKRERKSRYVR